MSTSLTVAELLTAEDVLPSDMRSELEWVRAVQSGLPANAVDAIAEELGFTMTEMEQLVIPRRTLAHRRANRQPLTREESDRLARIARVGLWALETFGEKEKAIAWLRRPNRALQGSRPIDLLDTDDGARLVEQVIGRLAYGVFS
jgi:putative toxin-antitoxin system antitoxin component (TIGR02293 family)